MSRPSTLLKVISILFIIFGAITVVMAVVGLACSAAVMVVSVGAGFLSILLTIVACAGGVLEFIAGLLGFRGTNLRACNTLAIIILVLTAVNIILNIIQGSFAWTSLLGLVLPVLYFLGVRTSR